jgi:hypothetical protein
MSIFEFNSMWISINDIPNVSFIDKAVAISPTIEECYIGDVHLEIISKTGQGTINAPPASRNAFSLT